MNEQTGNLPVTTPQDPGLWRRWEEGTTPDEHRMSPRRVTVDGTGVQRWCSCGWQGQVFNTALAARRDAFHHVWRATR